MYSFKLDADTIERMTAQFKVFMSDRERVHALLGDYVADYRAFSGTALARYEYLREKYKTIAPNLTHLVYDEDGKIYWSATDISILLNRDSTSITRTMQQIEGTENWRLRLYELRKLSDPNHVPPVYVYKEGIFDLMIDFYEEEYLQRFMKPRRGKAISEEEAAEIYRFWSYLKTKALADKEIFSETSSMMDAIELPDIPPMSLKEIIRLITGKLFTIRMGAFFTVLFALGYELSRRWNVFYIWLPILSVAIFVFCVLCIHRRKFNPGHLANIGASALLLCLLWLVGLLAQDGYYMSGRQSAIFPFIRSEKPKLVLNPSPRENTFYFFIGVEDIRDVKEFFYRIKPDEEYRSTGFMPQTNPTTGLPYPNMVIPNEKHGLIEIDVKFKDVKGREQGPYSFKFDSVQLEIDAAKDFVLNQANNWIRVRRPLPVRGVSAEHISTFVHIDHSLFSTSARNLISKVMYGINKETPDTPFEFLPISAMANAGFDYRKILDSKEDNIQFVSAQVFFKDGTSTDVRVYSKQQD